MTNAFENAALQQIHIAAALIEDGAGRLLLVRKRGTRWFMQAGGKIESDETSGTALVRELQEELGLALFRDVPRYLGRFSAPAANEPNTIVVAEIYHIRVQYEPNTQSEIEEARWVNLESAFKLPLAPLTREIVLPIFQAMTSPS
ncbi:MAG: NUDIX domain-containing protein [Sphingomonadales bacterium]|nr:NUDIX domain-containing protein [Sphingomonadales bacterium]